MHKQIEGASLYYSEHLFANMRFSFCHILSIGYATWNILQHVIIILYDERACSLGLNASSSLMHN